MIVSRGAGRYARKHNVRRLLLALRRLRRHLSEDRAHPLHPEKKDPPLLVELRRKRMSQGSLEPCDAKRYQFMLADLGLWDKLSTWCLWNHQELHAEVLALRMTGARPSSALQCVIATVPKVLFDPAAPTMPPFLIFGIHL